MIDTVLTVLAALVVLTIHEYAHAITAYRLGDPTAKSIGRLSLNPLRHLDPIGALCMVFFHFGWAKPVPINARYFKKPKRDFALTALAGPLSNLISAFVAACICLLFEKALPLIDPQNGFLYTFVLTAEFFFLLFHHMSIGIAVFNLIPIPPLDGSRLLNALLPDKTYFKLMKYEKYFYYGILAWLFLGSFLSDLLLRLTSGIESALINFIASVLSLDYLLSCVINFLSDVMFRVFSFIS